MNYERLLEKRTELIEIQKNNTENLFDNFDKAFEIDYAHSINECVKLIIDYFSSET